MNRSLIFVLVIIGAMVLSPQANAQNYAYQSVTNLSLGATNFYHPSSLPFQGVRFSTSISNTTVIIGKTNILHCVLCNQSSNDVLYASITFAYLTNKLGSYYQITPESELQKTNAGPAITFAGNKNGLFLIKINVKQRKEWSLPFVINSSLPSGDYELHASQGVVTSDARYSWEIIADSLEVRVIK